MSRQIKFKPARGSFRLNGKRFFIYSGEVHYFRIPRNLWSKHLDKLKQANCNTVSTYIPWCWHEYEDNKFDFTGRSEPRRDLKGFLRLAEKKGLYVIVKPGPYILAEYKRNGLPQWLFDNHPETQAIDACQNLHPLKMTTYMHPVYLKYAERWYEHVMPVIKEFQSSRGKPIIMMQLCNEIAFYYWFSAQGDYNETCLKYYRSYLKSTFKHIKFLNLLYGTHHSDFSDIMPPQGPIESRQDFIRYHQWHHFYRDYYAKYLGYLLKKVRGHNIKVPVFHNLPGWIDGRALEYPVNIIMYDKLKKKYPEIMLGVDHIPETVDFRNLHDDLICNQVTQSLQPAKPLMGVEIQAGSRHHKTRIYAHELELFYKACIVHGLKGINFYMFSQGINPPRQGALGPVFYWQTPLNVKASQTDLYDVIRQLGKFVQTHQQHLLSAKKDADIAVGIYRPYYYTEFTIPAFGQRKLDAGRLGLDYDPQQIRDSVLFDGLLRSLQLLNYDYDVKDIKSARLSELSRYKQLWVVSLDYMDEKTQQKLASYVESGGHLIMMPTLATKDMDLNKCTLLKEHFDIRLLDKIRPEPPKIDLLGIKDFSCLPLINIYDAKGQEVVARTEDGRCCGISKKIKKGKLTLIGTAFSYELAEHLSAYKALIKTDKIEPAVKTTNEDIICGRLKADKCDFLYIFNYHRRQIKTSISLKEKQKKEHGALDSIRLSMPPTYGLITPLNLRLSGALKLIYTTSDLLSFKSSTKKVLFELKGHPDLAGKLVLKSPKPPRKITLNNEPINSYSYNQQNRLSISYTHPEGPSKGFELEIKF